MDNFAGTLLALAIVLTAVVIYGLIGEIEDLRDRVERVEVYLVERQ